MDKNNSGLFIVAIVALFLIVQNSQQTISDISEEVVVDEEGNIVGMGTGWKGKVTIYTPLGEESISTGDVKK